VRAEYGKEVDVAVRCLVGCRRRRGEVGEELQVGEPSGQSADDSVALGIGQTAGRVLWMCVPAHVDLYCRWSDLRSANAGLRSDTRVQSTRLKSTMNVVGTLNGYSLHVKLFKYEEEAARKS